MDQHHRRCNVASHTRELSFTHLSQLSHILVWRFTVIEHYTLERWNSFLLSSFPQAKGYAVGYRLFELPGEGALREWGERRAVQELEGLRDALGRAANKDVRVFVKDAEELRREKYAQQQAAKATGAKKEGSVDEPQAKKQQQQQQHKTQGGGGKGKDKAAAAAAAAPKDGGGDDSAATVSHIDLRVGLVLSAAPHPDGDTLYVEQIDVGEPQPRTIVSGIRAHVPLEQFVGARVVVMCNLKEKPLRGVNSNGMICCASITQGDSKTVRLLDIAPDVKPGTRVQWAGEADGVKVDAAPMAAKKLTKLLGGLRTDGEGNVVFGEHAFRAHVDGKPVTCKSIPNGVVG